MKKVTIHRALAELKTLDDRIKTALNELQVITGKQGDKKIGGFKTKEEYAEAAKASYQSVKKLIENKANIKSAIVESNSKTKVKIGDLEMTVADAITYKSNIKHDVELLNALEKRKAYAIDQVRALNEQVEKNAQTITEATYGKDNVKSNAQDLDVYKEFLKNNSWEVLDPIGIDKEILSLKEKISSFQAEADAVLSESNAVTFIEIKD